MLTGCGGGYAPVTDRSLGKSPAVASSTKSVRVPTSARTSSSDSRYYRVRRGDTLYSIAFRYGKDFRALARANGIDSHYRIYPGQRLRLAEAPVQALQPAERSTPAASSQRKPVVAQKPKAMPPRTTKPVAPSASRTEPAKTADVKKSTRSGKISWRWPAKGRVIQRFQSKGKVNKGLNIATRIGDPVLAAAGGQVVYAGSGLLGYGNLVIINHNQQYLSAYAHNSKILVKEADRVKRGEKIAESGDSGTTRSMLHFEIRKDGKPVNPLYYLPRR